jgi:zinc transporter ZupT
MATLSAAILLKHLQKRVGIICAFSSGFFIALALFELLPNVLSLLPEIDVSLIGLFSSSLIGFLLLLSLNFAFSRLHLEGHRLDKRKLQPRIGLFSTMEFCAHSFLEGVAIGVSFQLQFSLGFLVAVAVIAHDFCDGISTLALMLNSGNTLRASVGMLLVGALAPVLGAVTTLLFNIQDYVLAYALSFLLGSFLYIGAGMLLPDAYRMNRPIVTIALFLVGFILIFLFSIIIQ